MSDTLSSEQVTAAVKRYWDIATHTRAVDEWTKLFSFDSMVFGTSTPRLESGQLVATRRGREYLSDETDVSVELGPIQVTLLGPSAAIACYVCKFKASKIQRGLSDRSKTEALENGRMTQVFRQQSGNLEIVHEHFSVPVATVS